ncbi:MAG: CDP-glycerol glycerophosphotransferase family protein [Pseudoxanthomonas sp.]
MSRPHRQAMERFGIGRLLGMGRRKNALREQAAVIAASGLFDAEAWLRNHPEAAQQGLDPLLHYLQSDAADAPCEFFDRDWYLHHNPDVVESGLHPLYHFCAFGWQERRNPGPDFDTGWYLDTYLAGAETNPLAHYLQQGRAAGLLPCPAELPEVTELRASGTFDTAYYLATYPDVAATGIDPVQHYFTCGAAEGRNPCAMFDSHYYLRHNPDVAADGVNPLLHFCRNGWKELRNPSRDFDVWWYWSQHMDPASEAENPLAHYLRSGRDAGLETRPQGRMAQRAGSGLRYPEGQTPRRLCLFAGYDPDGLIDDCVIDYVRELARFADVYYLADCQMPSDQLQRLAPHVKGAWAERHGGYDFGSWRQLVQRLGWDAIAEYDELLLVNDSSYLLKPLDEVFARMDSRACDWWGLQATKGIAATRDAVSNSFRRPIPMETVRNGLLDGFERDYRYDFLIGSYFTCYRQPVLRDSGFRRQIDAVTPQSSEQNLVLKYQAGLTRWLIARGHAFDTFARHLYPFHPVHGSWYFRLLDEGFPLLKRQLPAVNHYAVPALEDGLQRIAMRLPSADLGKIRHNLQRVVDPQTLYRNLHVGRADAVPDGDPPFVPGPLLQGDDFLAADQVSPKHAHWWAFPVCAFTGVFSGNERAVFEEVKDDPAIHKIVLTRDAPVQVQGCNVEVVPLHSARGQYLLMRAGNIFIKHDTTRNIEYPLAFELHNLINLWHGIPFKRIGCASLDTAGQRQAFADEHARYRAVICSSPIDRLAMAAAFHPLGYHDIWMTGLPRNDFILREFERLPSDLRAEALRLRGEMDGRRLVLFMPTFRNAQQDAGYRFNAEEVAALGDWLHRQNAVLGIREHMADRVMTYGEQLRALAPLDLSAQRYPDVEILYRESAALVTDYSSSFIDYMLTGKPALSFAYDEQAYLLTERGSFYPLDDVFPGKVCRDFVQLQAGLEALFDPPTPAQQAELAWKRHMFFAHMDDGNARRVVERVKRLSELGSIGTKNTTWSNPQ